MSEIINTFTKYLGPEFQQNLMWQLLVEPEFCDKTINNLSIDYFDDPNLKRLFLFMKEYFKEYEKVPNLQNDTIILAINKYKSPNSIIEQETLYAIVEKIRILNNKVNNGELLHSGDAVQKETNYFIKQQEYRVLGEFIIDKAKTGDIKNKYIITEIEEKIEKIVHIGDEEDYGTDVFENIENIFKKDFRETIPTGIKVIDEVTGGGLGKGEVAIILAPGGLGKAQPLSSKILTPTGWTTMGDINVGDLVIGSDGKSQKVLGVYPQGKRPIYKVEFNDQTSVMCDKEHLWSVNIKGENIVLTIDGLIKLKTINSRIYIPTVKPITYIKENLINSAYTVGYFHENNTIPKKYLFSSIENRTLLLRGLLDKNGYVSKNGLVIYNTESKELTDQIKELVLSLGGYCEIKKFDKYKIRLNIPNIKLFTNIEKQNKITNRSYNKYIKSITYSHEEEAQCIYVENDDHLYVTDDYILTHNTTVLTKVANTAFNEGKKVLQIILEDTVEQIQRKHSTIWSGIKLSELEDNEELVIKKLNDFHRNVTHNGKLLIKHFSQDSTTMLDIRKWIIKYQKKVGFKFDIIILDYLDCVESHKKSFDKNDAELIVVKSFLALASDFNIPCWSAIQGNRGSYSADFLNVNDMGGSIKRYQKAHLFMSLAKPEEQKDTNLINARILKARFAKDGQSFKDSILDNDSMYIEFNDEQYGHKYSQAVPKINPDKSKLDEAIIRSKMTSDFEKSLNSNNMYTIINNQVIPEDQVASETVGDFKYSKYQEVEDINTAIVDTIEELKPSKYQEVEDIKPPINIIKPIEVLDLPDIVDNVETHTTTDTLDFKFDDTDVKNDENNLIDLDSLTEN